MVACATRPGSRMTEPGRISPDLPRPMAWLGCHPLPGRTGTDPGGPLARGRTPTCLPPAAARPARRPAPARPPLAARPAGWRRRPGRRGRRGRQDHGAAERRPAPARSARCPRGRAGALMHSRGRRCRGPPKAARWRRTRDCPARVMAVVLPAVVAGMIEDRGPGGWPATWLGWPTPKA